MIKYNTVWACAALAALLTIASCADGKKETHSEGHEEYKTLIVSRGNHLLHSDYSARLTGQQIVEVRPQVSGNITAIRIREGDRVAKGQTLFVIDQVPYEGVSGFSGLVKLELIKNKVWPACT